MPNRPSRDAPRAAPPAVATSASVEPSNGPAHGLHTRPSSPPSANAPISAPPSKRAVAALADDASGVIKLEKRRSSGGTSITTPNAISSQAPAWRTSSGASDSEPPRPPTSRPISLNVIAMPSPTATGAARWRCTAPPTITGNSGKTHGDSVVNAPAATLSAGSAKPLTSDRALQRALQLRRIGLAARTAALGRPMEDDQRRLRRDVHLLLERLFLVVVDLHQRHLQRRVGLQRVERLVLRPA